MNPNTPGGGLWQQVSNFGSGTGGSLMNQMQTMLPQILGIRSILNSSASPAAAALAFENLFEKPVGTVPGAGPTTPNTNKIANTPHRESAAMMYYQQLAGLPATAGSSASSSAAMSAAMRRAQHQQSVQAQIAKEEEAAKRQIEQITARMGMGVGTIGPGIPAHNRQTLAVAHGQIAAIKAGVTVQTANQAAALTHQTAAQKAELAKQTSNEKAGTKEMTTLIKDVHSGSMKQLQHDLTGTHATALKRIEKDLDHDHSTALKSLSTELVKVHQVALAKLDADLEKQADAREKARAAAAATAQATALNQSAKIVADEAKRTSDQITDSTKVYLDQQAQNGLTGAALAAAQAQTSLDQITAANNQAIDAAQLKVDQAASGSQVQQAQAAMGLAQAQATAQIQQAQATSVLDKANAAATAAQNKATSTGTTTTATTTSSPTVILNINGSSIGPQALMTEVAWSLKTGALPVAVAAPVAA